MEAYNNGMEAGGQCWWYQEVNCYSLPSDYLVVDADNFELVEFAHRELQLRYMEGKIAFIFLRKCEN